MVRDPELLRQMAIKDFDHFQDHSAMVDPKTDKLFGNGLLMLKGGEWREMRATMSPVFTGSKMRQMFELVSESANQMAQFLTKKLDAGETIDDEMRDLFMKYTNDTMASCAFGVKVNSFENENNEFLVAGKEAINFGKPSTLFRSFVVVKLPILAQLLNIQIFQSNFYKRVVLETMEERQKQNISRPDLINIFMGIRRGITGMSAASAAENKQIESNDSLATVEESHIGQMKVHRTWTDDQLVAQSFLFYFGGFDFIAGTMSLTSYALALNTDVQDKLYEEIREMNDRIDGRRLDYDSMQKMRYLDQVVCETLRMWPVIPTGDRMCVKDYVYDDGDLKFELKRGNVFTFPIYGFHHDEKYFSDPYTFNPDRFSAENKHNITPGTYLPFGVGPRNCIGIFLITFNFTETGTKIELLSIFRFPFGVDGTQSCDLLPYSEFFTVTKCPNANSIEIQKGKSRRLGNRWRRLH